jgi:hypothetical protein
MDPNYFGIPKPNPHHSSKPGADPHQSQKLDPGRIQIKIKELLMEP